MASANGYRETSFKASRAQSDECKQLSHKHKKTSPPHKTLLYFQVTKLGTNKAFLQNPDPDHSDELEMLYWLKGTRYI